MSIGTIILIVLVLILVGAIPAWPHSRSWGYGPVITVFVCSAGCGQNGRELAHSVGLSGDILLGQGLAQPERSAC